MKRRTLVLSVLAGLVLGATVIAALVTPNNPLNGLEKLKAEALTTTLEQAHKECGAGVVEDDGYSLRVSTAGDEESSYAGATYEDAQCVLVAAGAPDHVLDRFGNTRAIDGRQMADWDGMTASWIYDPGSGSDLNIVDTTGM